MRYPNQPADISDQNWRVSQNIEMILSRGDVFNSHRIARILQNEYGEVPDSNLLVRLEKIQEEMNLLREDTKRQLAAYMGGIVREQKESG